MSYRFVDSFRAAGSGWNCSSQIYFGNENLHVSDSSSVHHQELFTVHSAMVYVIQVCRQLSSRIRMEHPDPAVVGFIIRKFVTMHGHMNVKLLDFSSMQAP
jgi:hypothetical protein